MAKSNTIYVVSHGFISGNDGEYSDAKHLVLFGNVKSARSVLLYGWVCLIAESLNQTNTTILSYVEARCKYMGFDSHNLPMDVDLSVLAEDLTKLTNLNESGEIEIDFDKMTASWEVQTDDEGNTDIRHIFEAKGWASEEVFRNHLCASYLKQVLSRVIV